MEIVLFRIHPRQDVDKAEYGRACERMGELVHDIDGFVSVEELTAADGSELAVALFESTVTGGVSSRTTSVPVSVAARSSSPPTTSRSRLCISSTRGQATASRSRAATTLRVGHTRRGARRERGQARCGRRCSHRPRCTHQSSTLPERCAAGCLATNSRDG